MPPLSSHAPCQVLGGDHARLRGWVSELRAERQRLEDQLLQDDVHGGRAQAARNDLDKQVQAKHRGGLVRHTCVKSNEG